MSDYLRELNILALNGAQVRIDVEKALAEDVGSGDKSAALLPADQRVQAIIITREPMIMAGQPWVNEVFYQVDPQIKVQWMQQDGAMVAANEHLCHIEGSARNIVTAERTALNFLQTLSGTATKTFTYIKEIESYPTKILDTRKTLPGLRYAQKYAVSCGGGVNHRMGLYDAYLIKENHILAAGSIQKACEKARQLAPNIFLEIEVENLVQLQEAFLMHPDRVLLDNFSISQLHAAVSCASPYGCQLEASGGVSLDNLQEIAATGVHFISVGDLTKSVKAIDLSLLVINAN